MPRNLCAIRWLKNEVSTRKQRQKSVGCRSRVDSRPGAESYGQFSVYYRHKIVEVAATVTRKGIPSFASIFRGFVRTSPTWCFCKIVRKFEQRICTASRAYVIEVTRRPSKTRRRTRQRTRRSNCQQAVAHWQAAHSQGSSGETDRRIAPLPGSRLVPSRPIPAAFADCKAAIEINTFPNWILCFAKLFVDPHVNSPSRHRRNRGRPPGPPPGIGRSTAAPGPRLGLTHPIRPRSLTAAGFENIKLVNGRGQSGGNQTSN